MAAVRLIAIAGFMVLITLLEQTKPMEARRVKVVHIGPPCQETRQKGWRIEKGNRFQGAVWTYVRNISRVISILYF